MRLAVPLLGFPCIFTGQILLGHEAGLFPLYLIPVVHTAWVFGARWGAVTVVLAVALWIVASSLNGQLYSSEWFRIYNGLVRGVIYALGAVFILLFKRTLNTHRERMEAMRALLNTCHGCGAVQGSDGQWIPMSELAKRPQRQVCECPACAKVQIPPES